MWWAGSRKHDLYLGSRRVALCEGDALIWAAEVDGVDEALKKVKEALAAAGARLRVRIWLSGGICRPFLVSPMPGVRSAAEAAKVAAAQAGRQTGLDGECGIWMDRGDGKENVVAVAVRRTVIDTLTAEVTGSNRLLSIRPWWAEVLRHALARTEPAAAVGVQDCDSLTVLAGSSSRFELATTFSPVLDSATADAAWARCRVSASLGETSQLFARLQSFPGALRHPCALGGLMEIVA